jgi:two-component system, cell cycle sensor histidine kinase and response regulator CckA
MMTARKPQILVVEDDPQMRESLSALLRLYGYECQTSKDLQNALDVLSNTVYDLILLDLRLGDQSGFSVMDCLKDKGIDTRVIIVTGEQSERKAITALKNGAVDYLKKPFEPDELIESVKNAVSRLNQHREDIPSSIKAATPT